jgi:hypothetical protein
MLSTHVKKYPSVCNFVRKYAINKLLCKSILVFILDFYIHRLGEDNAKEKQENNHFSKKKLSLKF